MSIPPDARAIIEAMRAGAMLYQEANHIWYLAGANHPHELVDADTCEWLEAHEYVHERGNDDRKRWYSLGSGLYDAWQQR
jgi:hypothetical protein